MDMSLDDRAVVRTVGALNLPATVLIGAVRRDGTYFAPTQNTMISTGDTLIILADSDMDLENVYMMLGKKDN